eukprot:11342287-Ditylum_brightwellii.AAC.1
MSKNHADVMVIVKTYMRNRDGRGAYTALYHHNLGTNALNDLVMTTEASLGAKKYKGETRRDNFEKYVTHQKKCHNVLDDHVRFGYKGMDERTK